LTVFTPIAGNGIGDFKKNSALGQQLSSSYSDLVPTQAQKVFCCYYSTERHIFFHYLKFKDHPETWCCSLAISSGPGGLGIDHRDDKGGAMEDIVKITLWLPDQQALNEVLSKAQVSLDCGAPRRESDGSFRIILYASPEEAKRVRALGYRQEEDANYGKVLAQRQNEVSKTDRFEGGKVKPTGIGEKR